MKLIRLLLLIIMMTPIVASAQTQTEIGGSLGYGFEDFYKVGVGIRGGISFENQIYLGGLYRYYFGETNQFGSFSLSTRLYTLSAEVGYNMGTNIVMLRPYFGMGYSTLVFGFGNSSGGTSDKSYLSGIPGFIVLFPINPNFNLGLETNYHIFFANDIKDSDALSIFVIFAYEL